MTDVMIDIETLGRRSSCVVLSIGAVKFDRLTGVISDTFYRVLERRSQRKRGAHIDPETRAWWTEQSLEAINAVFETGDERDVAETLNELRTFCDGLPVWGNGATFDISIMEQLAVMFELPELFPFWLERDVRTVVDLGHMIGVDHKSQARPAVAHHALDDAVCQAEYVAATIRSLT